MRAGAYCRKSTQEKGKEQQAKSVNVQADEARRYAERKGWTFIPEAVWADDAMSGVIEQRPGLSALLSAIESPASPIDVLIVSEQSRIGRDTFFTLNTIKRIEEADVAIHAYLDDRPITLADSKGEIEQFIAAWSGSDERTKAVQ